MVESREQANEFYADIIRTASESGTAQEVMAELGKRDLFFLLTKLMARVDVDHDWLYERCREVQLSPDGYLDLWSRAHYKSTIITMAKTIQDVLKNPEETVGIFSHTRPIAKSFLRQIKRELEGNQALKDLYPEVLWMEPRKEAPQWSEDGGLILRRATNPKEATIEAWGLVDGQPIGKHFSLLVYDDVVTRESCTSPEMIDKTTEALALSYNLGAHGGRRRFIGTRYHFNDTYKTVIDRGTAKPRVHAATVDGTMEGYPVFLTAEALAEKRRDMGPFVFGCQMLQNPVADSSQGFDMKWIRYWPATNYAGMNLYIVCDPASSKKKGSDYTVFMVIGLAPDGNYYLVDMVRDRLNLTERGRVLMMLHKQYHPRAVGYERYGMMADIEYVKDIQSRENYRFDIVELAGQTPKVDRIKRLVPLFESGRFYLPKNVEKYDYQGKRQDLVAAFINEEFISFPVSLHDDMMDCMARIVDEDLGAIFPRRNQVNERDLYPEEM